MSWTPITREQLMFAQQIVLWIRTARAAGYGGPEWLPSMADVSKSALLERIRSGKEPLPEPPPIGFACPWYALVEDPGPHYVPYVDFDGDMVSVNQNRFVVTARVSDTDMTVRDGGHDTSYRFRLFRDPEWVHPSGRLPPGGWFLRNVEFCPTNGQGEP